MIARWPEHIEPGRVSDLLWYFPDVLPTFAELAGAETPHDIDGLSIVPELLGETAGYDPQQPAISGAYIAGICRARRNGRRCLFTTIGASREAPITTKEIPATP